MKPWSIRKAAIVGLVVGVIGLLADIIKQPNPWAPMQIYIDVIETLTPVALFAAIAWIQNRFAKAPG